MLLPQEFDAEFAGVALQMQAKRCVRGHMKRQVCYSTVERARVHTFTCGFPEFEFVLGHMSCVHLRLVELFEELVGIVMAHGGTVSMATFRGYIVVWFYML
jgi:hypothetical protein